MKNRISDMRFRYFLSGTGDFPGDEIALGWKPSLSLGSAPVGYTSFGPSLVSHARSGSQRPSRKHRNLMSDGVGGYFTRGRIPKIFTWVFAGIFLFNITVSEALTERAVSSRNSVPAISDLSVWTFTDDPARNRIILAELYRMTRLLWKAAETRRYHTLLEANSADALMLPSGRYLVRAETARDDIGLLRAVTHEDFELLMQWLEKNDQPLYTSFLNSVSSDPGVRAAYAALGGDSAGTSGPINNKTFNDMAAVAFEIRTLISMRVLDMSEFNEEEIEFLKLMERHIGSVDLPKEFFDIHARTRFVWCLETGIPAEILREMFYGKNFDDKPVNASVLWEKHVSSRISAGSIKSVQGALKFLEDVGLAFPSDNGNYSLVGWLGDADIEDLINSVPVLERAPPDTGDLDDESITETIRGIASYARSRGITGFYSHVLKQRSEKALAFIRRGNAYEASQEFIELIREEGPWVGYGRVVNDIAEILSDIPVVAVETGGIPKNETAVDIGFRIAAEIDKELEFMSMSAAAVRSYDWKVSVKRGSPIKARRVYSHYTNAVSAGLIFTYGYYGEIENKAGYFNSGFLSDDRFGDMWLGEMRLDGARKVPLQPVIVVFSAPEALFSRIYSHRGATALDEADAHWDSLSWNALTETVPESLLSVMRENNISGIRSPQGSAEKLEKALTEGKLGYLPAEYIDVRLTLLRNLRVFGESFRETNFGRFLLKLGASARGGEEYLKDITKEIHPAKERRSGEIPPGQDSPLETSSGDGLLAAGSKALYFDRNSYSFPSLNSGDRARLTRTMDSILAATAGTDAKSVCEKLSPEDTEALFGRKDFAELTARGPPPEIYIVDHISLRQELPEDMRRFVDGLITYNDLVPGADANNVQRVFIPRPIYEILSSKEEDSVSLQEWREYQFDHLSGGARYASLRKQNIFSMISARSVLSGYAGKNYRAEKYKHIKLSECKVIGENLGGLTRMRRVRVGDRDYMLKTALSDDIVERVIARQIGTLESINPGGEKMHLPRVAALVVSENKENVVGILFELFPPGNDLESIIQKKGYFTEEEAVSIVKRVAEILKEDVHSKGIQHRDIKPGNIYLTQEGEIILYDFDIAVDSGYDWSRDESFLSNIRTPDFSPQKNDLPYDCYSLGKTLEAIMGDRFNDASYKVKEIVRKALNTAEAGGYADIDEFLKDIDEAMKVNSAEENLDATGLGPVTKAFEDLNGAVRTKAGGLDSVNAKLLTGSLKNIETVSKLVIAVPYDVFISSPDSITSLKKLERIKNGVGFKIVITGVPDESLGHMSEIRDNARIRFAMGMPNKVEIELLSIREMRDTVSVFGRLAYDVGTVEGRTVLVKDIYGPALIENEYMIIVTDGVEKSDISKVSRELEAESGGSVSIVVVENPGDVNSVISFASVIDLWVRSISGETSYIFAVLPPVPVTIVEELTEKLANAWKTLISL